MSKDQPSLPANRAFVVQIHAEAQVKQSEFRGRVEHIVSGQATHFSNVEELLTFMQDVLGAGAKPRPPSALKTK